jgi:hypothetical protein
MCKEINEFNRGYESRNNLMKDEIGNLLVGSHNILTRWKKYFSQLLNAHFAKNIRQIEIYIYTPLVPHPSPFEVEIAIVSMKRYKLPDSDLISIEWIQAEETQLSEIHKLMNSVWNMEEFCEQWKLSVIAAAL